MKVEERKMKNSEHFGELTSRMNHFREEVLDKNHISVQKSTPCDRGI